MYYYYYYKGYINTMHMQQNGVCCDRSSGTFYGRPEGGIKYNRTGVVPERREKANSAVKQTG